MALNRSFFATLFMLTAFVLFVIAALFAGGVFTSTVTWLIPAGLASMVLSFLCGGNWAAWNSRP
jgi:hypothetical protein